MLPVELRTERLVLSAPTRDDVPVITELCQDPLFERFMTLPWPYRRADAEFFVDTLVASGWETEREFTWALRRHTGGELLGAVGARVQPEADTFDVGYWLGAAHRGNGYMSEAVRAVIDWVVDRRGASTVLWECVVGNVASARVARACGFRYLGTGPGRVEMRDGSHATCWHGVYTPTGGAGVAAPGAAGPRAGGAPPGAVGPTAGSYRTGLGPEASSLAWPPEV